MDVYEEMKLLSKKRKYRGTPSVNGEGVGW